MNRIEKLLIGISLALMAIFTGLVVYAGIGLGIVLPTSHEHLHPFTEGKIIEKEDNRFEIYYVAKMWSFEPAELVLPENADVDLYVSAVDVNHGLDVIGTNLNLMAVPGTVNAGHHRFSRKGEYLVVCHEYCGLNHQNMVGKIKVVARDEYARLMQELAKRIRSEGENLSMKKDCAACHTADGTESIGPTFKGLFGTKRKLVDGSEVLADDAYLIDSIKNPDRQIVTNYETGSMPETPLSEEELKQLVAYIKSLK